jgi:hypothetical protein
MTDAVMCVIILEIKATAIKNIMSNKEYNLVQSADAGLTV